MAIRLRKNTSIRSDSTRENVPLRMLRVSAGSSEGDTNVLKKPYRENERQDAGTRY